MIIHLKTIAAYGPPGCQTVVFFSHQRNNNHFTFLSFGKSMDFK